MVVTYNIFPFNCQITPTYFSESETETKKCVSQRERVPHWWFTLFLAEDWSQIAGRRRRRLCVIPPVVSMSCLLRNQWPPSITAKFALSLLSRDMPELCCGHDASLKSTGRDGSAVGLLGRLKQKQIRGLILWRACTADLTENCSAWCGTPLCKQSWAWWTRHSYLRRSRDLHLNWFSVTWCSKWDLLLLEAENSSYGIDISSASASPQLHMAHYGKLLLDFNALLAY